ncbi:heme/hemin ABC transporter substrate-binding protein [Comamonas sp. NoAH]|uniref:heme/hemin ABC transporter substrate-binding protein n=1 Tax=Comamonas halotolerans TaxID=3041496 RepID=UPI0024E04DF5|nr:ABC transporter substrate-binding protein [Comamonas sp. NoAH]
MSRRQYLAWLAATGASSAWSRTTASARRLIAVGGAMTEVVYALGAESLLVATDTTSLYPEAATRTPKVGYLRQLSAEGLLSLQPDVIVGSGEAGPAVVLEQVRSAGVRVELVPTTHNFEEVLRKVALVGTVTGKQTQADALAKQLRSEWEQVAQAVSLTKRKPRALFILSHSGSPMVAGQKTAADALLQFAGAHNAVQQFEGYRPLTAEAMAAIAPEVIVNSTQGIEALGGVEKFWQRPELALTPAFRHKALVTMEASHLLGFGPRLPTAVRELHIRLLQAVA